MVRPCMPPGGGGMPLSGCSLTPGTTQEGIGAAHTPAKKLRGDIGVSRDPKNISRRYCGRPRVPKTIQWEYRGVPCPQNQPTEVLGLSMGTRRKNLWGYGVPLDPRTNSGRYRATHGSQKQFSGSIGVFADPTTNPGRYCGRPRARE